MKLRNNAVSSVCELNNETILHLLWKCECTKQYIKELLEWLKSYDLNYIISGEYFMFGEQESMLILKLSSSLYFMLNITYMYHAISKLF